MTVEERIEHLANMTFLMDYHIKLGSQPSKWILYEWTYHNEALFKTLKENYDEAGNRKQHLQADDAADKPRSRSGVHQPDRPDNERTPA